ncbi:MAG: glycoside hydrolase family 15 protein [Rubrobacteraceae bacterium]
MKHHRYPALTIFALAILTLSLLSGARSDLAENDRKYPKPIPLRMAGLLGNESSIYPIPPGEARGASYLPGSNVLRLPGGDLRHLPSGSEEPVTVSPENPGARAAAAETRAWLDLGSVPGDTEIERKMAERALLDLRLLTRPGGATLAAAYPRWDYVWPRDAAFAAAAFAATGYHEESYEILSFLARAQKPDGTWEARYKPDGSPVLDGRPPQLDATGWFTWAVGFHAATAPDTETTRDLWPAVRKAADAAAESLGPSGLPPGGADYWEIKTWKPNLGTAAPLRAGLRSAADTAQRLGHVPEARRYTAAADRLEEAIEREFAPRGYPRTTRPGSGADAAVNFLAPPFAPPDPEVAEAVENAGERLTIENGGVVPGERWPQDPSVAWTPQTALFALSAAAGGDEEGADRRLDWLADHRTGLGSFPEKVDGPGDPTTVAPLAWTSAIVVLSLAAGEKSLPVAGRPPAEDG